MFLLRTLNFSNLPITRLREEVLSQFFVNYPYPKLGIDSFLAWVKEYQVFSPRCQFHVYSKPTISHYHVTICNFIQISTINCDFCYLRPFRPFFRSKTNHSCWSGANQIFSCIVFHVCARAFKFNGRAVKGSIQSMIDTHFWNFLKFFGRSLMIVSFSDYTIKYRKYSARIGNQPPKYSIICHWFNLKSKHQILIAQSQFKFHQH